MQDIPIAQRSRIISGFLALQDSWLFRVASVFQNASLLVLLVVVAYMLFVWRNPENPPAKA